MPTLEEMVLEMQNDHPLPRGGFRPALENEIMAIDALALLWQEDNHGMELGEFLGLKPYYPAFLDKQLVPQGYSTPVFHGSYWTQRDASWNVITSHLPCGCLAPFSDEAVEGVATEFSLSLEQLLDRVVQAHQHQGDPATLVVYMKKEPETPGFTMTVEVKA
jgi:hypothetical protein